MDVTYFIGNGFDLSLGLRTGYRSFLREYLKKPVKVARPNDPNAAAGLTAVQARAIRRGKRMICEHLRKGCINWSDMEAALGECTVYFQNTRESRKAYATLRKDIVTELSQYLIGQARMNSGGVIRPEQHPQIADAFAAVLENPLQGLPATDMQQLEPIWKKHSSEPMGCHFISFNYTNVLDKCLNVYRQQNRCTRQAGAPLSILAHKVFHAHGTVHQGMVFGVSNYFQIKNASLRDKPFGRGIIKPFQCDDNHSDAIQTVQAVLSRSKLLVVAGMSVGVTDSHWWNLVAHWLLENQENHVIIHYYDPCLHVERGDCANEVRTLIDRTLLEAIGAGGYPMISDRFHITMNEKLFGLRLVEQPKPEGFWAGLWHKIAQA